MKRLLSLFFTLTVVLTLISLVACSGAEVCTPCVDSDSDLVCDRCGEDLSEEECIPCVDTDMDTVCDRCGALFVTETPPELTLQLTTPPTRTKYYTGEAFDPSGMVVSAILTDGTVTAADGFVIGAPAALDKSVSEVFVYYGGAALKLDISVSEIALIGVYDARRADYGDALFVDGYYVGGNSSGFLVKDISDDTVLEVRGDALDYSVGDRIRFLATLEKDSAARVSYLAYSEENASPIIYSSDNEITAELASVTGVATWDRMTKTFKESSFKIGNYYKIYADRIYVIKNADGSFTLHLNDGASDASSIRSDGTRTVNISSGTNGADYIASLLGSHDGSIPGKCFSGVIHAISLGYDADSYDLTVLDDSWVELGAVMTAEHQALMEVAHAFYYKGGYIHYDQYGSRRNINPSPEMATSTERLHLDCSSFVNAVYYEAFGENVQPYPTTERSPQTGVMTNYARDFLGINPDVIGYWDVTAFETEEEKAAFVELVAGTLEIGDVIVYRRTANTGHAIIYAGDGYFLHSTGGSYEYSTDNPHEAYDSLDAKGTISKLSLSTYLYNKENGRYILAPNVTTVSIIRPLARGLSITDRTEARLTIPGISIETTSSAKNRSAVYQGSAIIYNVSLKNNGSETVSDVFLTIPVPNGTEFIGGANGMICSDGVLTYTTSVSAGATVNVTYVVKVTAESGEIVSSGNVNGVDLNRIFNTVSASLTETDSLALVSKADEFVTDGRTFTDPLDMAKALYSEALGLDLFDSETAISLIDSLIDSTLKTYSRESAYADLLVSGLYGGYDIRSGYLTDNERTRLVVEANLSVGDVIVAEYGDTPITEVYVYLGGGNLLAATSDGGAVSFYELEESGVKNLLISLISFDRYVIIRPSQK